MADYAPRLRRLLRDGNGRAKATTSPKTKRRFPVDAKIKSRHTAKRHSEAGQSAEGLFLMARPNAGAA
jgi:hypothetical protein